MREMKHKETGWLGQAHTANLRRVGINPDLFYFMSPLNYVNMGTPFYPCIVLSAAK